VRERRTEAKFAGTWVGRHARSDLRSIWHRETGQVELQDAGNRTKLRTAKRFCYGRPVELPILVTGLPGAPGAGGNRAMYLKTGMNPA
jgi:hypothetical protein